MLSFPELVLTGSPYWPVFQRAQFLDHFCFSNYINDTDKDIDTNGRLFGTSLRIIVDTTVYAAQKLNGVLSKIHN